MYNSKIKKFEIEQRYATKVWAVQRGMAVSKAISHIKIQELFVLGKKMVFIG